jgi:D-lyxose ketol-isomerase
MAIKYKDSDINELPDSWKAVQEDIQKVHYAAPLFKKYRDSSWRASDANAKAAFKEDSFKVG